MEQLYSYSLGIDLGTTSVKVCILETSTQEILSQVSKETESGISSDQGMRGSEQDVFKIIKVLNECISKLDKTLLQQVKCIGICGQMHGVVFWSNNKIEFNKKFELSSEKGVSNLYTWQDARCDDKFLASLPKPKSHMRIHAGYGMATIFWMLKHKPEFLRQYNCCGTIQDFCVAFLCELSKPIMSCQNAASWGYFNCNEKQWNIDILNESGFPTSLLPLIKKSGNIVGKLKDDWHGIPKGTPIGVALGDLQCSVLSTLESHQDAVLNISTSAQIAFVIDEDLNLLKTTINKELMENSIEYWPYFENKLLAVAASLNGGNSLSAFINMLQRWVSALGFEITQSRIWETVLNLAATESETDLVISPTCFGERHVNNLKGSVTNIHSGNLELGNVFRALCEGLIKNLQDMMPREELKKANITRIVGNGSCLLKNNILQEEVRKLYQLPLVFTSSGDAAKGAAMAMNLKNMKDLIY